MNWQNEIAELSLEVPETVLRAQGAAQTGKTTDAGMHGKVNFGLNTEPSTRKYHDIIGFSYCLL